ncbi:envelope stress sensor histidine kinase CpxA [Pasteurella oralis]|uniref:envelope stress sensor histidine kinase CpxA n=1 Tax=Pasteurella oralis TaxID=1071947 RepID=UPI000C7DDBAB|nr:envelope stress sensor histidine kinase CpxA [Pasteurella oralis]
MPFAKESYFNTISFRIFAFFWLTFSLLSILIFSIPYFDSRIYSELSEKELAAYQQEIITSIRHNQIARILAGVPLSHADRLGVIRPVLVDENDGHNVLGASATEIPLLSQFMYSSSNPAKPLKKVFGDVRIVGPFSIHLGGEANKSYTLYFIDRVSVQKEIMSFVFANPAVLVALLILISTPLLWWLARSIGKPIKNLQMSAKAVSLGDFKVNKDLETKGSFELRQVGQSFNQMTEALEDLLSSQQVLLSSISHELRTPLTRLQLALALLRRRFGEENTEIQRIEIEARRLDKMINDLLLLSRQQLNSHVVREIFPINELWEEVLDDAIFEAEHRQLCFTVRQNISQPQKYYINGNKGLLVSAVENIVRNALKYTHSEIKVSIFLKKQELMIVIDDNGKGLDESEYDKIFQPFYRVDETRTRETGGTGLGLAIVANVVKEHHGAVWASASHLGGLCVNLRIPLWINS